MSEELFRKYRPTKYEDLLGNDTTIETVRAGIANGTKVFLFTGEAGTGKTTLARIVAKEFTGDSNSLDIEEYNSSNDRGIDAVRKIVENMQYGAMSGGKKVIIFDEAHKLTNDAQNALLKPLEEPHSHIAIMLCTTNPEKLITALKSRCFIVPLASLTEDKMLRLLMKVSAQEGLRLDPTVYEKIIEMANGGSRDALMLLSKVCRLDSATKQLSALNSVVVGTSVEVKELCLLLIKGAGWNDLAPILKALLKENEAEGLRQSVMGFLNGTVLNNFSPADTKRSMVALQCFAQADAYRNGKSAITSACIDYILAMK